MCSFSVTFSLVSSLNRWVERDNSAFETRFQPLQFSLRLPGQVMVRLRLGDSPTVSAQKLAGHEKVLISRTWLVCEKGISIGAAAPNSESSTTIRIRICGGYCCPWLQPPHSDLSDFRLHC